MRGEEKKLSDLLKVLITTPGLKDQYNTFHIEQIWKKEMGPTIATHTQKVKFVNGKLFIYLTSSVVRHELFLSRDKILIRLNDILGANTLSEIILR